MPEWQLAFIPSPLFVPKATGIHLLDQQKNINFILNNTDIRRAINTNTDVQITVGAVIAYTSDLAPNESIHCDGSFVPKEKIKLVCQFNVFLWYYSPHVYPELYDILKEQYSKELRDGTKYFVS